MWCSLVDQQHPTEGPSCPARPPDIGSPRNPHRPAWTRPPGTASDHRCGRTGLPGSLPWPSPAWLLWSAAGWPWPPGWGEHPSRRGWTRLMCSACRRPAPIKAPPARVPQPHGVPRPPSSPRSCAFTLPAARGSTRGPAGPGYLNPLRGVSGLVPERIDEGVDFGGSGPVYALGDAVITNAGENSGWPGGGWITYQLTDGPAAGLMVYLAEDVTPTIAVGQHVSSSTVIANMFAGGDGIETGWAQPTGVSAESELPEAGGIGGGGPFPTRVGANFDELLQALGVPAAPTPLEPAYGNLPANYPASW